MDVFQVPPMSLQYSGTALQRLNEIVPASPYLPQAGTLPPVNTYDLPYRTNAPAPVDSEGPSPLLLVGLAVGVWFLTRRRT